jgi:LmbE family N-acetylglucosaminyl deacetylase
MPFCAAPSWRTRHLALLLTLCCPRAAQVSPPQGLDAGRILHGVQGLGVVASVLYLAAHPDDENTKLISALSNGRQVRTAYLSLTRGDGGQNLIGPELGDALGVLRTQELLAARRIDGAEQFFTRAVDFGYTKSPEETFELWGHDEILADVVRVVRTFRPDVIVTRFATDGSGGHGQHTASALLAEEAFRVAADPAMFPEQIEAGLEPWQPTRLFFNGSTWWNRDLPEIAAADPEHWVAVDVGGHDPLLGLSYTEIAGRSRSQHKSQGFGAAETRGKQLEYFRLEHGAPLASPDLLDGIETSWTRFAGGAALAERVNAIADAFDARHPEASVPGLVELAEALDERAQAGGEVGRWARHHAAEARRLCLEACGVVLEANASVPSCASGETVPVTITALQRRPGPSFRFDFLGTLDRALMDPRMLFPSNANEPLALEWDVHADRITQPYWLLRPHGARYDVGGSGSTGIEPAGQDDTSMRLRMGGREGPVLAMPLTYTWVDKVEGQRTRPFAVTPVVSIAPLDPVTVVTGEASEVLVELEALGEELAGTLRVVAPPGWAVAPAECAIETLSRGESRREGFHVSRSAGAAAGTLSFRLDGPGGSTGLTRHEIDYPHIPPQLWYSPAEVRLVPLDVEVPVHVAGYVQGVGDDAPRALERLGVQVTRLDPATAEPADLDACEAIVVGIRAYNTVPALARLHPLLLDWVARGGTLLVQYQTASNDLVVPQLGPKPFRLTRDRVTREDAAPTFRLPDSPLLTTPNRLGPDDFAGWVQERGLYFAGGLDPAYAAPIAWNDPGEAPLDGALVTCEHGKGRFTYTGISLFRQLPAGVPGAYRLLANLLARRAPR